MPISVSTALLDFFNSRPTQYRVAELYTISTVYGQTVNYTSSDTAVTIGGVAYYPMQLMRGTIVMKAGLDVGEVTITFYPKPTDLIGAESFIAAVQNGLLDGASVTISRAYFSPDWDTYIGTLPRFSGRVSNCDTFSWYQCPITVRSWTELLNTQMPKQVYQPNCRRTLYDNGCTLNAATYAVGSSALSGSTTTNIKCGLTETAGSTGTFSGRIGTGDGKTTVFSVFLSQNATAVNSVSVNGTPVSGWSSSIEGTTVAISFGTAPADGAAISANITYAVTGYFDQGKILFTSGQNSGLWRAVKSYAPGNVSVMPPLPYTPAVGDTFLAYPGCDKTQATCTSKFNNLVHFSGEPYIPAPETVF